MIFWCIGLQSNIGSVSKVAWKCGMRLWWFIFIWGPNIYIVGITFRSKKLTIHWRSPDDCYFSRVTDYLLNFNVGMFFCRIIVENRFKLRYWVVILLWKFYICQNNIIRITRPCAVIGAIYSISFAWEIYSLVNDLWILVEHRTPLNGGGWPI
jgi:hypothetical protein